MAVMSQKRITSFFKVDNREEIDIRNMDTRSSSSIMTKSTARPIASNDDRNNAQIDGELLDHPILRNGNNTDISEIMV